MKLIVDVELVENISAEVVRLEKTHVFSSHSDPRWLSKNCYMDMEPYLNLNKSPTRPHLESIFSASRLIGLSIKESKPYPNIHLEGEV